MKVKPIGTHNKSIEIPWLTGADAINFRYASTRVARASNQHKIIKIYACACRNPPVLVVASLDGPHPTDDRPAERCHARHG